MMTTFTKFYKAFIVFLMIGATTAGSKAQMVALSESFDGTTFPPTGWTFLGSGWSRQTTGTSPTCTPHSGAGFARFNAFSLTSGTTGDLITPAFDLANRGANTPTVSFWLYRDNNATYNTASYDLEGITAYINTSASITGATSIGYVPRRIGGTPVVAAAGWYQYTFNVPASFSGATNYLILRGYSQFGDNIFIDDVVWQTYPTNRNIGVSQILNPVGNSCGNASDTIKVNVTNFSTFTANNFTVKATVTGTINGSAVNTTLSTVYSPTLAAGASVNIPVGTLSNLQGSANISITAFTEYANDLTKTNDTTKSGTLVINRRPAGTVFSIANSQKGIIGQGTVASPDVLKAGDTVLYGLTVPAGYTLPGYGSAWNIASAVLKSGNTVISTGTILFNGVSLSMRLISPIAYVDNNVTMEVTLQDLSTNCSYLYSRVVRLAPTPKVKFSFGKACAGQIVEFENNSTISSGTMSFIWDYGDPGQSNEGGQSRVYPNAGTYNVTLSAYSDYNFMKDTTITVTVNPSPVVDFAVDNACLGSAVVFTDQSTFPGSGPLTYNWNFGDGQSSASVSSHIYAAPGNYDVTLTVTSDKGCASSKTRRATQFDRPTANFTVSGSCSNKELEFTNGSSSLSGTIGYRWDFGDSSFSNAVNPKHAFLSGGTKNISLIAISGNACADTAVKTLLLKEGPKVAFSAGNLCSSSPVQFNSSSTHDTAATFLWSFTDTETSILENPSFNFGSPGNKKVKLSITNGNGCETSLEQNVFVRVQPVAKFSIGDDSICSGDRIIMNNQTVKNTNVVLYTWKFGNGDLSTENNPEHSITTPVSVQYPVKLIAVAPEGCADSVTHSLFISKLPSCDFSISSNLSGERKFIFTANETGNTNTWSFGDGGQAGGDSNQHQFMFDGVYSIKLKSVNATGCECESSRQLSVIKLAVNELSQSGIMLYPNPNNGKFNVKLEGTMKVQSITIYNVLGELVQSVDITKAENVYSIDMNNVPAGVYFVKVATENGFMTRKFTVSR